MAAAPQASPFVKQLASSNKKVRDDAFASLQSYLRSRASFTEIELLKLWKGLFFCMWMSDKPRVQQRLARETAGLVDTIPAETALPFLDAFWKTISREWAGIDVLRMNKFLFLIRQCLAASFRYFERNKWRDFERLEQYLDILTTTPLNVDDPKIPNGLRYHMLDIYVDELDMVDISREGNLPLEQLMRPIRALQISSPTKTVRDRAKEAVEDKRVQDWYGRAISDEATGPSSEMIRKDDSDEDEWAGIDD